MEEYLNIDFEKLKLLLIANSMFFVGLILIVNIRHKNSSKWSVLVLKLLSFVLLYVVGYLILSEYYFIEFKNYILYFILPPVFGLLFILFKMGYFDRKEVEREVKLIQKNKSFTLEEDNHVEFKTDKGSLQVNTPESHFLGIAGTRSGKTTRIGIPLLIQYLKRGYIGFVYDAKELDYTKKLYWLLTKLGIKKSFYYINFRKLDYTYRTNIIKPKVVRNYNFLAEIIEEIGKGLSKGKKQDEWYDAGLGIIQGIAIRMYLDYPQYCTIAHVSNFMIRNKDPKRILDFVSKRVESQGYADEFIKASGSDNSMSAILWSGTQIVKKIASNKNICYVLSGDDFDFNLIEEGKEKIISVSNDKENETVLNGLIGSMVNILAKQIDFGNKQKTFFFMDEGTTFTIPNFSTLLGVIAEYKVSFAFLTQSFSNIVNEYKRDPATSLLANFNNLFLGKTNVAKDAQEYSTIFGKHEIEKVTKSRGSSSGYNKSSSTSEGESTRKDKEFIFDSNHFMKQKKGQFTCNFLDSNYEFGTFQFEPYYIEKEELEDILHIVDDVTQADIDKNYRDIVDIVQTIK